MPDPLALSVSPVTVTLSLAVATMSPALACPAATCSLPWRKNRPPSFSSVSRPRFATVASGLIRPERTRISEMRPVYGSEIVLNTMAAKGASGEGGTVFSAPSIRTLTFPASTGDGRYERKPLRSVWSADVGQARGREDREDLMVEDALLEAGPELLRG